MGISKAKKLLLVMYNNFCCEECHKKFKFEELEIHRIRPEYEGGTYEHRNCKVVCSEHHEILNSAQRICLGIQN